VRSERDPDLDYRSGNRLIHVGTIVTIIGLCIVIFKVWHIPGYWVPLMVGIGILLVGLVRRAMTGDSRDAEPPVDRR
jgi:hypothetical protein